MKIVINRKHGGFGLSEEAVRLYAELKGVTLIEDRDHEYITLIGPLWYMNEVNEANLLYAGQIPRNDPELVEVVERLGDKANDRYAQLKVVEIPDDVEWQISEYDGIEWVAEVHRTWH